VRREERHPDPDAPLSGRPRRRLVLAAAAAAGLALAASVVLRLAPVGAPAIRAREDAFAAAAARALERDTAELRDTAERLQASPEFSSIVDGGGAEVRPARLFKLLGDALPPERGTGAVFFDPTGRPVAWAGDAAGLEAERDVATARLVVSYHVTRVFVGWVSPRGEGGTRGTLLVTRRFPTGIIRPDLIEYLDLPGGPSRLRLRLRAAEEPGRLFTFFVEPASPGVAEDDVARRRALPAALALAACAAALGVAVKRPVAGFAAARFALLLGMPRSVSGLFAPTPSAAGLLGLFATPADVLLTGLLAAAAAGALARSAARPGRRAAVALAALPFACVPWIAGRLAGTMRPGLFEGMSIIPSTLDAFAEQTGLVALSAAGLLAAGVFLSPLLRRRRARALTVLALGASGAAFWAAGGPASIPVGLVAAVLMAAALAHRAVPSERDDLLARVSTAVFVVAAATLLFGAGLADGGRRFVDRALVRAERAAAGDAAGARRSAVARWEARVGAPELEPWLPAGDRTHDDDLARALWVRGADEDFPELGDMLTIRSPLEATASSFGVMRPGSRAPEAVQPVSIPSGFAATFLHVAWPREADRDALLSWVASRDVPDRVAAERLEWDAAGRPSGPRGESIDLPPALLAAARRKGRAVGVADAPDGPRRVHVTSTSAGFSGFAAPVDPPLTSAGAAFAAGEAALVVLVPLLFAFRPARRGRTRSPRFFGTFRARLVALVVLFGALPLAASVVLVRVALANHATRETGRRARDLVTEGRRVLQSGEEGLATSPEGELNRAAAVIGTDLLHYRDGTLVAASRALPVSASIARERLSAAVAQGLADGRPSAVAARRTNTPGAPRVFEAAEALSRDGRDVLAVVVAEDEALREAADGLVLLSVAVALVSLGLGGRAALALGQPLEDLLEATGKVGEGRALPPFQRPENADLARLVDAFGQMSARVEERTQSLARERASAVRLLENLTAAVVLFRRRDGAVLLSNDAADRVLPGGSLAERLGGPAWAPLRAALDAAESRPSPYETRVAVPGLGGERLFRVAIVTLPEEVEEGRAILLLEDLTEFTRADRLAAWVDAARAIAHDIKNPLTPIRLAAERLKRFEERHEAAPPGAIAEISANVLRQVAILTERIGRLGRFGDPAALERQPFDAASARALLEDVAADFRAHERLTVSVDVAEDLHPFTGDRLLLRDALTNFLVNATEAVGGRGGAVALSASNAALPGGVPGVRFACADDGPGPPEGPADRLFEPAFSTKSRGSGMGLAAVRRTAERHGGAVFADARPGGGLVIGFTLPALSSPT
jgi:signal transduction histidine kinase